MSFVTDDLAKHDTGVFWVTVGRLVLSGFRELVQWLSQLRLQNPLNNIVVNYLHKVCHIKTTKLFS